MSGDALGYVVKYSPFKGATFTIHLCIADSMSDLHDYRFWMAVGTLADKARCSRRTAGLALDELVNTGFLDVLKPPVDEEGKPTGRPGHYQFLMPEGLSVVFEPSWAKREGGAQSVRTPGAQSVRTGAQSGNTGCAATSHNTENTKKNHWAPQSEKSDPLDATAAAFQQQVDKNMGRIADDDATPPDPDRLAKIRAIKAARTQERSQ